jgi:hypothetical protein
MTALCAALFAARAALPEQAQALKNCGSVELNGQGFTVTAQRARCSTARRYAQRGTCPPRWRRFVISPDFMVEPVTGYGCRRGRRRFEVFRPA